jgi:hypothetical protein
MTTSIQLPTVHASPKTICMAHSSMQSAELRDSLMDFLFYNMDMQEAEIFTPTLFLSSSTMMENRLKRRHLLLESFNKFTDSSAFSFVFPTDLHLEENWRLSLHQQLQANEPASTLPRRRIP